MPTARKLVVGASGKLKVSASGQLADKNCCCGGIIPVVLYQQLCVDAQECGTDSAGFDSTFPYGSYCNGDCTHSHDFSCAGHAGNCRTHYNTEYETLEYHDGCFTVAFGFTNATRAIYIRDSPREFLLYDDTVILDDDGNTVPVPGNVCGIEDLADHNCDEGIGVHGVVDHTDVYWADPYFLTDLIAQDFVFMDHSLFVSETRGDTTRDLFLASNYMNPMTFDGVITNPPDLNNPNANNERWNAFIQHSLIFAQPAFICDAEWRFAFPAVPYIKAWLRRYFHTYQVAAYDLANCGCFETNTELCTYEDIIIETGKDEPDVVTVVDEDGEIFDEGATVCLTPIRTEYIADFTTDIDFWTVGAYSGIFSSIMLLKYTTTRGHEPIDPSEAYTRAGFSQTWEDFAHQQMGGPPYCPIPP